MRYQKIVALLALATLAACSWTRIENNNQQAQGITNPSTPVASPSPGADCALGGIEPGSAGDVRSIAPGSNVAVGVSLFGTQGLPLVASCLSHYP